MNSLQEKGFSTTPGSIAKLFADIINKNISDFYEKLTSEHILAFLTTSKDEYLDSIGLLVGCTRNENEKDNDYKKRISYQTVYMARANELSIRLAILNLDGIDDVVLKRYSHGPGSFTVIPITNDNSNSMFSLVSDEVYKVVSCGERVIVKSPEFKYVKLDISLIMSTDVDDTIKQELSILVSDNIEKYINSMTLGSTLIINKLTEVIMGSSSKIINYACNNFTINNEKCLLINQGTMWDEKFIISPDEDSIVVR